MHSTDTRVPICPHCGGPQAYARGLGRGSDGGETECQHCGRGFAWRRNQTLDYLGAQRDGESRYSTTYTTGPVDTALSGSEVRCTALGCQREFCGRCWVRFGELVDMVPCAPPYCDARPRARAQVSAYAAPDEAPE